jgi:ATP-dependent Lhr-like helicase
MNEDEIIKNLGTNTKNDKPNNKQNNKENNKQNNKQNKNKNQTKNDNSIDSNNKFKDAIKKINYSPSGLAEIEKWLIADYYLDSGSARSIINYFLEQRSMIPELPSNNNLLIEGFIDSRGYYNVIFHYCFGRRVNDALARTYAYELSKLLRSTVRISLTDDNFMITFPKFPKSMLLKDIEHLVTAKTLKQSLKAALGNTELFKQRFRHCAVRSFMILRNYKGRDISVRKQLKRSQKILELLNEQGTFPVIDESYNEILNNVMDLKHAVEIQERIDQGTFNINYSDFSKIPSPFTHNVIMVGISDIILMEDRSTLLRELHQQVLKKVFSNLDISKPRFETAEVSQYFRKKLPIIQKKAGILELLRTTGPLRLFKERGKNIYKYISPDITRSTLRNWSHELVNDGQIISIIRNNDQFWIPIEHIKYYLKIYINKKELKPQHDQVLTWLDDAGSKGRLVPQRLSTVFETSSDFQQVSGLTINEFRDTLRDLEKRYLVHRSEELSDGSIVWYAQSSIGLNISDDNLLGIDPAIDFLVQQYLSTYGPSPVPELAYDLELDEDVVVDHLSKLERMGRIVSGNFVLGRQVPQYILTDDLTILEKHSKKEKKEREKIPTLDGWIVQQYLHFKLHEPVENAESFFDKFGLAFGLREIFRHTKHFKLDSLYKPSRRSRLNVAYGRFLNGRLCYVPLDDVPSYVSAYRESALDNKELTVLNMIKTHRGISRKELSKALDVRMNDLKDIIDKLERNLYIIREVPEQEPYTITGAANKYIFYDLKKRVKDSQLEVIKRVLSSYGPINIFEIKNYTGFSRESIGRCLDNLLETGEVIKFITSSNNNIEMYIMKKEYQRLISFGKSKPSLTIEEQVQVLSLNDSISVKNNTEIRARFGDGWFAPIFLIGNVIGFVDIWRMAGCLEVKDIRLDQMLIEELLNHLPEFGLDPDLDSKTVSTKEVIPKILWKILDELNDLMDYYKQLGLDVIRIKNVLGSDIDSLSEDVLNIFLRSGFKRVQGFLASGNLDTRVFQSKQIMRLILDKQHVLPETKFVNPLEVIRTMGGIRSNYELQLRLDGNFYDIREFRKNLNLAAGPIIPGNYSYCTDKDIRIYKIAKGRELDYFMEYMLENMPADEAISAKNLFARLTLSREQFNDARKRLYEGLYIIRNPMNKYMRVGKYRNLTKQYARKYVLKRVFNNFGIFSAEVLSAFMKREYSMKELRRILHELEGENFIRKGFFKEGEDTLYWIKTEYLKMLDDSLEGKINYNDLNYIIISPQDQLASYLSTTARELFGLSSCFIIVKNYELVGAFKVQQKQNKVEITDFNAPEDAWDAVEKYFRVRKMDIIDESAEELYTYNDDI